MTRSGTTLYLNGAAWKFTGYDMFRLTSYAYGHNCGGWLSDSELAQSMDEMKNASGAAAVRTWFFQAYGGPGNWFQFDRVVNAAAARGIKIIPVLVNQWGDCEPWPPSGQRPYRSLAWYQGGYRGLDYGYTMSFRDFAVALAAHYANNSTIAFWQLVNEAEAADYDGGPCAESAATAAMRGFADDVSSAMKSADPHHLVSLGTLGGGQCGTSSAADYEYVHAGAVDLCEYHDYTPGAIVGAEAARIDECRAIGRPTFVGESGISASVAGDWGGWNVGGAVTTQSLNQRATFFSAKMNAQLGYGAVGYLIWEKSVSPSDGWAVGPGDPVEPAMAAVQARFSPRSLSSSPTPLPGNTHSGPTPSRSGGESASSPPAAASAGSGALDQPSPAALRATDAASPQAIEVAEPVRTWMHYLR